MSSYPNDQGNPAGAIPVYIAGVAGSSGPPADGALLIGDGTGFALATLTEGTGIKVTNGEGTITIAASLGTFAVAALPSAVTSGAGARAFVNNATTATFGSAPTGGGSLFLPVFSDGTIWRMG